MISHRCYCDRCGSLAPLSIFHVDGNTTAQYTLLLEDTGDENWALNRIKCHLCENCYAQIRRFIKGDSE